MSPPFISVVIPVWNSPALIRKRLAAIQSQTYPRSRFEVLVVDNGSTDETAAVVREFSDVILLSEPVAGSYRARNLGIRSARGDYVAFTDADCVPDRGWLEAAAAAVDAHPDAALLAGRIDLFRNGPGGRRACENYERLFAFNQARNVSNGVAVTANWISPRQILVDLGGFKGELKSGGDYDLSSRIRRTGGRIVYVDDMRVGHPVRASFREIAAKTRRIAGGRFVAHRPVGGPVGWFVLLGKDCLRRLRIVAFSPVSMYDKFGIAAVALMIFGVSLSEIVRLSRGGEAIRQ